MRILKHGSLQDELIFTCERCGCIFSATLNECMCKTYRSEVLYFIHKCPECGGFSTSDVDKSCIKNIEGENYGE